MSAPLWSPEDPLGHFEPDGTEPCIGHTRLFFTVAPGGAAWAVEDIAKAKRICGGCHRQFECLSKALYRKERHGIWGGRDFYAAYNPAAIKTRKRTAAARKERGA